MAFLKPKVDIQLVSGIDHLAGRAADQRDGWRNERDTVKRRLKALTSGLLSLLSPVLLDVSKSRS